MITDEMRKKLDDALRRYHKLGWKKRRRLLVLIAEYVPQDRVEHVLDRNEVKE